MTPTTEANTTSRVGSALPRAGKVVETTAAHIEAVTRFDRSNLSEAEPEVDRMAELTVTLSQTASFRVWTQHGNGQLPAGVDRVGSEGGMHEELAARLQRAEADAPGALQRWADENQGTYRRLMPRAAAFLSEPKPVGYQFTCTSCEGACTVLCGGCNGKKQLSCGACGQTGQIRCWNCQGSTRSHCYQCQGQGHHMSSDVRNGVSVTVKTNCSYCQGQGTQRCTNCWGGWNDCGRCGASGWVNCGTCKGHGRVNCSDCAATGWQNERGEVLSSVAVQEGKAKTALEDARAAALLIDQDLDRLPQLGELRHVSHSVAGNTLQTVHTLEILVRRALVEAAGKNFELHGFGLQASVFDFRGIAGHLLHADLHALSTATLAARGLGRRKSAAILPALVTFLQSELNMLIAEEAASSGPEGAQRAVQENYKGMVSREYVPAALAALHASIAKVYASQVAQPAVWTTGTAALAGAALSWLCWPSPEWPYSAAAAVLAAGAAWFGVEYFIRRRISSHFEQKMASRVLAQAEKAGGADHWRTGVIVAVVAAACVGSFIPWKLSYPQRQALSAAATQVPKTPDEAVRQWQAQGPDLSLRRYGDRERLQNWAAMGHAEAANMLAWSYLLGADGSSKDFSEAERWILAPGHGARDTRVLLAVIAINKESTPAAIKAAAADLNEGAKRGMLEASYWLGRTLLAQQGPVYDAKRGVEQLRKAAAGGHAHAALILGRTYAEGRNGQARDVGQARRYLQLASAAGLAEASLLMAKL